MTNQEFCYWLQGYFEITKKVVLTKEQVLTIHNMLKFVDTPLGEFTQWLSDVIDFFSSQQHNQKLLNYFLPLIRNQLNLVFYHVIDHSYNTNISLEQSINIHDGLQND